MNYDIYCSYTTKIQYIFYTDTYTQELRHLFDSRIDDTTLCTKHIVQGLL